MEMKMNKFLRFLKDESGATAIEYGLIAAGVALAIVTVVGVLGENINATFTEISDAIAN
jgi:pilus assembly protein Flp/PilA